MDYYKALYLRPANMAAVLTACLKMGVDTIQAFSSPKLVDAILQAEEETGKRFEVVVSMLFSFGTSELELLKKLQVRMALLHASITDRLDFPFMEEKLKELRQAGFLTGVAMHNPLRTLAALDSHPLDIDAVMLPVNRLGFMMKDQQRLLDWIAKTDKFVIAKKTLAAGRLAPEDGLTYVLNQPGVDAVALGVASIEEAEETFDLAEKIFAQK